MAEELFRIQGDAPAAPDLMFWSLIGHESLSRASRYELTVLSTRRTIPADEVLGYAFDVVIRFQDQKRGWHERHCAGHAVRFSRVRQVGRYHEYRIGLRSWFWLLTKRRNSRILQDKPVLEVLDAVFEDSPIKRFRKISADQVIDGHKPHRYCVQFEESDHDFVSRLLEEEGIYYWFDAHDAPGTMHLADTASVAHEPLPVAASLEFQSTDRGEARYNQISSWIAGKRLDTGRWAAADSNFKTIRRKLQVEIDAADSHELADFEEFEFPGDYFETDDADAAARRRGDEMLARRERHWAVTGWPDVAVGRTFKYWGDPDASRDGEYLIGSCTFVVVHPGYEGMGDAPAGLSAGAIFDEMLVDGASDESIAGSLRDIVCATLLPAAGTRGVRLFVVGALPGSVPYRPPRLTPRTRMPGPQSAIVVGPEGDEIHTDEFGRVKVHFHWDRYDESNAKSTCWIRVSQPWAGKEWGGYFIPRIGQEVIVDFLNGDPDRPIVIGRVYNDDQRIPFEQPTYSGFKTRSTPGGAPTNFNALRFRDDKGKEQVFIHAERRMDVRVKKNKYETVQGASHMLVGGGYVQTAGGTLDSHTKGDLFARADSKIDFSTGGAVSIALGAALLQHIKAAHELNARKITVEALTSIVIKVGSSFLEISPMGVAIVGPLVRINSGGSGPGTGPLDIEDPLDAAGADTGEPGYLDRLPRGGGGGRRKRHSDGYHARPVVRQPDGSFTYGGDGIRVSGTPEFTDATLQTLASLDGIPTGHQLIDNLQSNGHTVLISENNVAAADGGGGVCNPADGNGVPAGETDSTVSGAGPSDGSGTDSTVHWIPGTNAPYTEVDGTTHRQPDEALLGHELIHADHLGRGNDLINHPDPFDPLDNQTEALAIGVHGFEDQDVTENNILRDLGENWRRRDHGNGAVPTP